MGKIRNTASMMRRGRDGNTTYYVKNGEQITRQAKNDSNYGDTARRSSSQQLNRTKLSNLVNFYKASKAWMPKAFETKKGSQSDYNKFVSLNMPISTIRLPKDVAAVGACVAEGYMIAQGSLPMVNVTAHGDHFDTDLKLGALVIDNTTTVAQFAQALIENNVNVREGMQLSFISYQQMLDAQGYPHIICTPYEVVLDTKATDKNLRSFLPAFCSMSTAGQWLGTNSDISLGGFAYVLSETISGKTSVSSAFLTIDNSALIAQYTGDAADAVASYGVDSNVFLDSNEAEATEPTAQPLFISYVNGGNGDVAAGQYFGSCADHTAYSTLSIAVANGKSASGVTLKYICGSWSTSFSNLTMTNGIVNIEWGSMISSLGSHTTDVLSGLELTGIGDETLSIEFATAQTKKTLTLVASPAAGGTVTGSGQYTAGASANIGAAPKAGYTFSKWSDGNTSASRSIVVNEDLTLTATFVVTPSADQSSADA